MSRDFNKESDDLYALETQQRQGGPGGKKQPPLGREAFAKEALAKLQLSKKRALEYYDADTSIDIRKKPKKPEKYSTVWARQVQDQVQMDLWDIGKTRLAKGGRGYGPGIKFALLVIEVKSRKVWGELLKGKNDERDIIPALRRIFQAMYSEGRDGYPRSVNGDGDFNADDIRRFFRQYGITRDEIRISHPGQRNKNVLIERFIRTLRMKMAKLREPFFGNAFPETFQRIIREYNNTVHAATAEEPKDVFNRSEESRQGMPGMGKSTRPRKALRRTRRGRSTVQQVIHPLPPNGVRREGWPIGSFVRVQLGPSQDAKFSGQKTDDPNFEDAIFEVSEQALSKQSYYVRQLVMTGPQRGTVGNWLRRRGKNKVQHRTRVPVRGWEMKRVTRDNPDLRNWLELKAQRERGEIGQAPPARPVRPQQAIGRRPPGQRQRRPRRILDL